MQIIKQILCDEAIQVMEQLFVFTFEAIEPMFSLGILKNIFKKPNIRRKIEHLSKFEKIYIYLRSMQRFFFLFTHLNSFSMFLGQSTLSTAPEIH